MNTGGNNPKGAGGRRNRAKLREKLSRLKKLRVKTWVLVVLLLPLLFVDATLLRLNHIRMTELRNEVMEIDASIGESEDAAAMKEVDSKLALALTKLKQFTFSHIVINVVEENGVQNVSFGTGPFYLEHQYLRAAHQALDETEQKLAGDGNPYGNIYGEAGEVCRPQAIENGWAWNSAEYINCMLTEIQKYPAANDIQDTLVASLPSTELYRHNYASPVWAPEPAGFVMLLTVIIILILIFRMLRYIILRIALIFV